MCRMHILFYTDSDLLPYLLLAGTVVGSVQAMPPVLATKWELRDEPNHTIYNTGIHNIQKCTPPPSNEC